MYRCPHCKGHGVSAIGKLIAAPWAPATCRLCAGKSSESICPTQALRGAGFITTIFAAWASAFYSSWLPLLGCIGLLILAFGVIQVCVPLLPVVATQVQSNKRGRSAQIVFLLIVGALLAGLGHVLDA
jgi:hypothetical protein